MIKKVKKRDGRIVDFGRDKVEEAIWKAAQSVGGTDRVLAGTLADEVVSLLDNEYGNKKIPTVEDVQDMIEKVLIENGHSQTSKAFILYRKKRQELREAKSALGVDDDMKLSFDALRILVQYKLLQLSQDGKLETPRQMFTRVARALAQADSNYKGDVSTITRIFENLLYNLDVVPSASILRSAGLSHPQLSDGFVLPIQDSVDSIFDTLRCAALLHKSQQHGFGVGISFSPVRARGSKAGEGNAAGGPVVFLRLYDRALRQMNPYGTNLAFLNVHHPDIIDFITSKESHHLQSFGISVLLTKEFIRAVEEDKPYALIDPSTHQPIAHVRARSVFDMIATIAWRTGDPAVVFLDALNKTSANPFDDISLEATTPSGEHPLFPYEGCFTASINLAHHIHGNDFDWDKLKATIGETVHLLDNAIDVCDYPIPSMRDVMERTRRIGVGIMGWADALIHLEIPYTSDEACVMAEKLMKFINTEAKEASILLARKRGVFGGFKGSASARKGERVRNSSRTTISPSGVASAIAGCSQGIEPYYAISYLKRTPTSETFEVIPIFEEIAHREAFHSPDLMKKIALAGSVHDIIDIPQRWRAIFTTVSDCSVQDHLAIQVAFQKYTDNGVSKTINLPATATITEVEDVYTKAYALGCRSIHIYREGSSPQQLINSRSRRIKRIKKKLSLEV